MEPRPFSHGYFESRSDVSPPKNTFNGATTFQPWIHSDVDLQILATLDLQWSHDLSAMDTTGNLDRAQGV